MSGAPLTTIGVVGVGAVGTRAVRQLLAGAGLDVVVVDEDAARARAVVRAMGPRATAANSLEAVYGLPVVVLAGPAPHAPWAEAALAAGSSVVSVSDAEDDVAEMLALDTRDRTLVLGAGFSPGLACLLARHAARSFDTVEELYVAKHGTGGPACAHQHHRALAGNARVWRDGEWITQRAGSGRELCWFPEPIGGKDCYRAETAEPLLLQAAFPDVARIGARVSARRRDRLTAQLPMLRPPHPEGDLGAIRIELRGARAGERAVEVLGAIDRPAIAAGAVAAVTAAMVIAGDAPPGCFGLGDARLRTEHLLVELARRGVRAARFTGTAQAPVRSAAAGLR
jgi:NADP oxidoreductase coenzyme F420-dependent